MEEVAKSAVFLTWAGGTLGYTKILEKVEEGAELLPRPDEGHQAPVELGQCLGLGLQHLHTSAQGRVQLHGLEGKVAHMGSVGRDLGLQQVLLLQQLHCLCQLLPPGCGAGQHLAGGTSDRCSPRALGPRVPVLVHLLCWPGGGGAVCWCGAHLELLELAGGTLYLLQQAQPSLQVCHPLLLPLETLKESLPAPSDLQLPRGHENRGGLYWAAVGSKPVGALVVREEPEPGGWGLGASQPGVVGASCSCFFDTEKAEGGPGRFRSTGPPSLFSSPHLR